MLHSERELHVHADGGVLQEVPLDDVSMCEHNNVCEKSSCGRIQADIVLRL